MWKCAKCETNNDDSSSCCIICSLSCDESAELMRKQEELMRAEAERAAAERAAAEKAAAEKAAAEKAAAEDERKRREEIEYTSRPYAKRTERLFTETEEDMTDYRRLEEIEPIFHDTEEDEEPKYPPEKSSSAAVVIFFLCVVFLVFLCLYGMGQISR